MKPSTSLRSGVCAVATVLCGSTLTGSAVLAENGVRDETVAVDLAFVYHLDADMPEQDVFVEREGEEGVYRVTKADRDLAQPVFASSEAQPHDPFAPEAIGPYEKGAPLGVTLGEWLGASGSGTYRCESGEAEIEKVREQAQNLE